MMSQKKMFAGFIAAVLLVSCAVITEPMNTTEESSEGRSVTSGINMLISQGKVGQTLINMVVQRTEGIMPANRPYVFDGVTDCYGFVRQVWNPLLTDGSIHSEDFNVSYYNATRRAYRVQSTPQLPVGDAPSPDWALISSLGKDNLKPGDIIGTTQGHRGGGDVHYGLYAGKVNGVHYNYQCYSPSGAYKTTYYNNFIYYYKPTHNILAMSGVSLNYNEFKPGILARQTNGDLLFYKGDGKGNFAGSVQAGHNWNIMDSIIGAADFNRDGHNDMIARNSATKELFLYPGSGSGNFGNAIKIGSGWGGFDNILCPGDFNGDGNPDIIARNTSNGSLVLYPGNGSTGFKTPIQIGNGWAIFDIILGAGDLNRDGFVDVIARNKSNGTLSLYLGNGSGGWKSGPIQIGNGWGIFDLITGAGDFDGDKIPDVIARNKTTKTLTLYPGTGSGGFADPKTIGTGWGAMDIIFAINLK